jgi:hypothetical protein
MAQIIPITSNPNQALTVTLTLAGEPVTLQLAFRFSEMADYWVMSISDQTGALLLDSIPLVTGLWPAANILAPYAYLNIGSAYVVSQTSTAGDDATNSNLGSDFLLVWDETV